MELRELIGTHGRAIEWAHFKPSTSPYFHKQAVEKYPFQNPAKRSEVGEMLLETFQNTLAGYKVMQRTIVQLSAKAQMSERPLEHNMCGRRVARSPL